MDIDQLLQKQGITKYRLAKDSGIPYTTINDLCNGKTRIKKCSVETIYKIAKVLDVTMEDLVEKSMEGDTQVYYRSSFETYKSNVCHRVKETGDIDFIIETLQSDEIQKLYNKKWYPESLYLLAMVDYLSRENSIPICTNYNEIRSHKLNETIYPASIIAASVTVKDERFKKESLAAAIPEFIRFNIVESEIRNVY